MAEGANSDPRDGWRQGADRPSDIGGENTSGGQRVEERFEQWGRRLGSFVAGAAARAREGAEDIVAEAQSIRRGERD